MMDIAAQDTATGGMEGGNQWGVAATQQTLDPFCHLTGGLVGEGDGQDIPGTDAAVVNQMGDAVGNDTGLARACAGQDQKRPFAMQHGHFLGRVEV